MPTYDYMCENCGHRFEAFQNINAAPLDSCPVCKSHKVHRVISGGVGLIFKGSGFYITDYKRTDHGGGNGKHHSSVRKTVESNSDKKSNAVAKPSDAKKPD